MRRALFGTRIDKTVCRSCKSTNSIDCELVPVGIGLPTPTIDHGGPGSQQRERLGTEQEDEEGGFVGTEIGKRAMVALDHRR